MFREPLYKKRSLGDKVDVTFAFIRENFRQIMKTAILLSIPFCCILSFTIVYGIAINDVQRAMPDSWYEGDDSTGNTIFSFFTIITDILFIIPLALTYMQQHYNHPGGLSSIKTKALWRPYFKIFLKSLSMPFLQATMIATLIFFIVFIGNFPYSFYYGGTSIPVGWAILCYLLFLLFYLTLPAYCVDNNSYLKSLEKSFKYCLYYFFNTLAFSFCIFVLCLLIFMWEIALVNFITEFRHELIGSTYINHEVAFIISWIVIGIIWASVLLSMNIALITGTIGMTFQYGHSEDKYENRTLKEKIKNFENL